MPWVAILGEPDPDGQMYEHQRVVKMAWKLHSIELGTWCITVGRPTDAESTKSTGIDNQFPMISSFFIANYYML